MHVFKEITDTRIVEETQELFGLKIAEGARLCAPEGKLLTMTWEGIQMEPRPGTYEGEIVLTITEPIEVGTMARSQLKTAVYIGKEGYEPEKSVVSAVKSGVVGTKQADALKISSLGDCFSGVIYEGTEDYTLNDLELDFAGNGNNESVGEGAGVIALGSGTLTLNRAKMKVRGAARSAIFDGGDSTLIVNNSEISSMGGVLPPDYQDSIAAGRMKRVPWMLGLRGNSRATNVAERSTATYNNCVLTANEWGVMSTDGVEHCQLTLNGCNVRVTGKSGYGAFALLDTLVTLNHTTVNVPDYGLIVANGPASGLITGGTRVNAGRFGVMCFRNTAGTVTVNEGSILETGEACFVIKGCKTKILADNCTLHPANGILLQLMDTDDPRNPRKYFSDGTGEDVKSPNRDLSRVDTATVFSNLSMCGDIYNSTSNIVHDTGPDMGDPHGAPAEPVEPGGPGMPPPKPDDKDDEQAKNLGVTLKNASLTGRITATTAKHPVDKIDKRNCEALGRIINTPAPVVNNGVIVWLDGMSRWMVTGDCYLSSLTLEAGASIAAPEHRQLVMMVDGVQTPLETGTYVGDIRLKLL